eukprot:Skav229605  [mRNA]  locus=scaffold510:236774:237034:+ [translate_table: standard]
MFELLYKYAVIFGPEVKVTRLKRVSEAIILDAYSYEKEKAAQDKTLLQQISEVWRRLAQHRRGERVNLSQVYDAFKKEFKHDVSRG